MARPSDLLMSYHVEHHGLVRRGTSSTQAGSNQLRLTFQQQWNDVHLSSIMTCTSPERTSSIYSGGWCPAAKLLPWLFPKHAGCLLKNHTHPSTIPRQLQHSGNSDWHCIISKSLKYSIYGRILKIRIPSQSLTPPDISDTCQVQPGPTSYFTKVPICRTKVPPEGEQKSDNASSQALWSPVLQG